MSKGSSGCRAVSSNDETSGHIDNLCCFVRPAAVALTWTDDRTDPQYDRSCEAFEHLKSSVDARGRSLEVHKIPQPAPLYMTAQESQGVLAVEGTFPRQEGRRLAASYINFYIANRGVLVPQFGDPLDRQALQLVQGLFPDRSDPGVTGARDPVGWWKHSLYHPAAASWTVGLA